MITAADQTKGRLCLARLRRGASAGATDAQLLAAEARFIAALRDLRAELKRSGVSAAEVDAMLAFRAEQFRCASAVAAEKDAPRRARSSSDAWGR